MTTYTIAYLLYPSQTLTQHLQYPECKIHFMTSHYPFPGSCMYLHTMLTACDKSSFVHTVAYIKLLIALAYGMWDMYSQSSIDFGDIIAASMKWGANGVLTDFASLWILNFYSTFCKYPFWVKQIVPLFLSLSISMPSTLLASPKSFFLNSDHNYLFNLLIDDLLFEVINISSTNNSK